MAKNAANNSGANLGFEGELWNAADHLRGHMDAGEYKHVVLGLVFLKYISDAFQEHYEQLTLGIANPKSALYTAENVFWVPKEARWRFLQANAKWRTSHDHRCFAPRVKALDASMYTPQAGEVPDGNAASALEPLSPTTLWRSSRSSKQIAHL